VKNNSLAMLATVAGVGVLAWWVGFFDPETCSPDVQQPGWTSCEEIANQQAVAFWVLLGALFFGVIVTSIASRRKK
jgi:hypothetical protein